MKLSPRAIAAKNFLIQQRRIAVERKFHQFTLRTDRALTVNLAVEWFKKYCCELNVHSKGNRVFLTVK